MLLLHGDQDSIVPLSSSEQALKAYQSAELEVISGAGHGFYGEEEEQAVESILTYLEEHKKGQDWDSLSGIWP